MDRRQLQRCKHHCKGFQKQNFPTREIISGASWVTYVQVRLTIKGGFQHFSVTS